MDLDYRTSRVTSDLPAAAGTHLFDRGFSWDEASRIGSTTDYASAALNGTYGYDTLDRLTSASQGTNAWGFTFDAVGNRLTSTVNAATTTYGYFTGSHRLQSLTGAQVKTYAFDAAGNMASDGTATWTYGGNNRPTQVTAAGTTTQFSINALGQRVRKATGTTGTRFVHDEAGRLWGEYSDTGALISETIWLEDLPVALIRPVAPTGWEVFYVHADHLGTPRMITRPADNAIVWRWDNAEPFGNSQPDENPSGLGAFAYNLRFPGQYFDSETGTHYNYARDYDTAIGRYIQSDPIGLEGGINTYFDAETGTHYNYFRDYDPAIGRYIESDPIGLRGGINTYAYVRSRPLNLIDRLGLRAQMCCKMIVRRPRSSPRARGRFDMSSWPALGGAATKSRER
jgi:RHS repeat-associated protein